MYRSVLLKCRTRRKSGGSDSSKNDTSGQSSPVTVENVEKSKGSRNTKLQLKESWWISKEHVSFVYFLVERSEKLSSMRSTSTLPIPHPGSHPPTPTILVHSVTGSEEGEERGDLIMFYNRVIIGIYFQNENVQLIIIYFENVKLLHSLYTCRSL